MKISIILISAVLLTSTAQAQEPPHTWESIKAKSQALYDAGRLQEAHNLRRWFSAGRVERNGGMSIQWTMNLHYSNDAEINYNRNQHVAGSRY